jgi:C4-dicarboxylate-specific signal transduction histidine kinase
MPFLAQSRLTARILVWVVIAGGLVFSVVTTVTVLQDRQRMYHAAQKDARRNVSRNLAAISTGLWNYDVVALNATLAGLVQSGSIVRAEIRDLNRQVTAIERPESEAKPEAQWEVPILGPDNAKRIGTLQISESYREVRDVLARNLSADLLAELIKIAGLAALLFVIIYCLITRHLQSLAREVSNPMRGAATTPITLQRKVRHDELDTLAASINRFRSERAAVEDALLRDIVERKRVEATLQKAENDLSEALQIAQLAYWQYDVAKREYTLNDRFYSLLRTSVSHEGGYCLRAEDFLHRLLCAQDAPGFASYIEEAVWSAKPDQLSQTEVRIACADGAMRVVLVRCKAELSDAGAAVRLIGTGQDITEPRRAQEALRAARSELARASRLTMVGQMAASIAHEINQPLGAIVANANAGLRFLKAETLDLTEVCEALTQIVGEGHRASQVIGSVRAMFKKESQLKVRLDVNQVIRQVLALVRGELQTQRIRLQTDLSEPLPTVSGVPTQLQQVIFNLLTNAFEAMASISGRAHLLRVSSAQRKPHDVLITVEDSGSGINPRYMDHIFDPFFTTKSHGMGLGLSICRTIIEAHDGRLSVSPGANGGSAFQIALPAEKVVS